MAMRIKSIKKQVSWESNFDYVDGELFWKSPRRGVSISRPAGSVYANGYIVITLNGDRYMAHRIVWEMFNGYIEDGMEIDHVDHDTTNNKLSNLRLVSKKVNCKNKSLYKSNKSGACGVCWHKDARKWNAYIKIDGKRKSLGYYRDVDDAIKARKDAEIEFCFHKNHGK